MPNATQLRDLPPSYSYIEAPPSYSEAVNQINNPKHETSVVITEPSVVTTEPSVVISEPSVATSLHIDEELWCFRHKFGCYFDNYFDWLCYRCWRAFC